MTIVDVAKLIRKSPPEDRSKWLYIRPAADYDDTNGFIIFLYITFPLLFIVWIIEKIDIYFHNSYIVYWQLEENILIPNRADVIYDKPIVCSFIDLKESEYRAYYKKQSKRFLKHFLIATGIYSIIAVILMFIFNII